MDLSALTVLEVGEYVAVPYAGKLLSDLGASVVKLEPPGGDAARRVGPFEGDRPDPDASEFFGYLNTGKESVVRPESDADARDLIHALVEAHEVDLVLGEGLSDRGIDPRALSAAHDPLSVVSVTGFGATGSWREYDAPDLVAWAESGHMNKMGYPDSTPMRPRIKAADYWTGQTVAIAAMAALFSRDLQGGSGQYVDLAKREAAVSTMERFVAGYSWSGATSERVGHGYPRQDGEPPSQTIYETADGYVSAAPSATGKWRVFCAEFLGRPELAEDERIATRVARRQHREETAEIIEAYTRDHEKWDLLERFQAAGIASGVTATPADLAGFEHLDARDFWQAVPLPNGAVVTMPGYPFRPGGPEHPVEMERAPRLGEHTAAYTRALDVGPVPGATTGETAEGAGDTDVDRASWDGEPPGPLDGVRVLDFTWVYAGPHASKHLAALGADVVKVESEHKPDSPRSGHSFQYDPTPTSSVSAYYNEHNQGKRGITLDLTHERGREVALDLAREADLVMENYSPTFMERVDLTYDHLRAVNEDIVYLSMPGVAKSGPANHYRAYGLTLQSMAGLDWISGWPDDPPTTSGMSWPDPTAGNMGAVAALVGLYHRELSGEGVYVELPQFEMTVTYLHKALSTYLNHDRMPERTGPRDEDGRLVQGVYPCRGEDRWAVLAVETDEQWERLCSLVGRPELAADERFRSQYARLEHHDAVDEVVSRWTRERSAEEVRRRLRARGVPAGIVADEADLMDRDPQLRAREYFTTHDHPDVGTRRFQGVPYRMADAAVAFTTRAPLFGEHTEEVLAEWLGLDDEVIADLDAAEALY